MATQKDCPDPIVGLGARLDKSRSIVSTFSIFVVYKSAVSTIQKSNYVGCFNLC